MIDPKDEMVKRILATRRRAARLKALHELCLKGSKRVCVGSPVPEGVSADPLAAAAAAEDQGCGAMQPVYRREGLRVMVIFPDVAEGGAPNPDRKQYLPAEEAYRIFKNMSDEAVEMLGLDLRWARPEWLLITVFPVPPPTFGPPWSWTGRSARTTI
jgi:DNA-directed RNA polymerase II subunit RPB1